MTSSCLRQAWATALACALPPFSKTTGPNKKKKVVHGKTFQSTMLQMRLTSQFKRTTSDSIPASVRGIFGRTGARLYFIAAHRTLPFYCGAFAMTSLAPSSSSPLMKMGVWMDEARLILARPPSSQWCSVFAAPQCRPGMWIERKLWMNQQPFLISSLPSICSPSLFPSIISVSERERAGLLPCRLCAVILRQGECEWQSSLTSPPSSTSNESLDVSSAQYM